MVFAVCFSVYILVFLAKVFVKINIEKIALKKRKKKDNNSNNKMVCNNFY